MAAASGYITDIAIALVKAKANINHKYTVRVRCPHTWTVSQYRCVFVVE